MQLRIKVEGVDKVRVGLQQLAGEIKESAAKEIPDKLDKVIKTMQKYPAKRPGQKYKRTYKLRDNWKVEKDGKKKWKISNRARFKGKEYPHYVVGDALGNRQAWMHKGRWKVFREVLDKSIGQIMTGVEGRVKASIRSKGFSPR